MINLTRSRLPLKSLRFFFPALVKIKSYSFVKMDKNHYLNKWEEIVNRIRSPGRMGGKQSKFDIMTSYTPQHVANYFLDKAEAENKSLSPLKLLKLVYIAYGWYKAIKDESLFKEKIEAWKHGPVIPSIYHEFKHFGYGPITSRAVTVDYSEDSPSKMQFLTPHIPESDEDTNFILDKVWRSYSAFPAMALRDMTHKDNTPWSRVYRDGVRGIPLNDDDIREHYVGRIREYIDAAKHIQDGERKAS